MSDKPLTENWAPSKWGANDRAGSANYTNDPANVAKALAIVKQNKVLTIGKYYHREAPVFGPRAWQLVIPGTPTGGPFGNNALIYHDELLIGELGQIGTQFDGPGHIGVNTSKGPIMYNGVNAWDAYERGAGRARDGRGPAGGRARGRDRLRLPSRGAGRCRVQEAQGPDPRRRRDAADSQEAGRPGIVTADDVKGITQMQGLREMGADDCVALHTGQGNSWSNDRYKSMTADQRKAARDLFNEGEPGFGISASARASTWPRGTSR